MNYEGNIIRPPSEADSIILQVTVGCSHNKCTFCGAYKGELFRIKDESIIAGDLDFAGRYCKRQKRVFLADGDCLIIPQKRLVALLGKIKEKLPWVTKVSLYGNAKAIGMKSLQQLQELKGLGLARIYMGLESGHDQVLRDICKGVDSRAMIEAARKVRRAGIFLSVTSLLGIGGKENSHEHARQTGKVLSRMEPNQIAVLTLMLLENTPLYQDALTGVFSLPAQQEMLQELKVMLENINVGKAQFQANHASNYLPINARLPRDKEKVLAAIDMALSGNTTLVPEELRAL